MSQTGNIQTIDVLSVHVSDLDRARAFYCDGIGLKSGELFEGIWAECVAPNGSRVGLHIWDEACKDNGGRPPGTVTGAILTVDDPHAFAKRVEAAGGAITDPVEKQAWGPVGGTFADPDGNEWIFAEPMPQA